MEIEEKQTEIVVDGSRLDWQDVVVVLRRRVEEMSSSLSAIRSALDMLSQAAFPVGSLPAIQTPDQDEREPAKEEPMAQADRAAEAGPLSAPSLERVDQRQSAEWYPGHYDRTDAVGAENAPE